MKQTGASYSDTATTFGMNNLSLIANWHRAFQEKGIEGLKPKPKGRPSMTKKPNKKTTNKSTECSLKELERENELLRLENAYLKKLKSFHKNPDVFLEKHKQQWHTNSKKRIQIKRYLFSSGYSSSDLSLSRKAVEQSG